MGMTFKEFISWLPEGATWVIALTLFFLLAGWISSISIAFKNKWVALMALFPLTNPIAVINLLFKNTGTAMIPVGFYALALVIWIAGGRRSHRVEFERLNAYEQQLKDQGEPVRQDAYKRVASHPDRNTWDHPYLKTLADAGQLNEKGKLAREQMNQVYQSLSLPRATVKVKYEDPQQDRASFSSPLKRLHQLAVQHHHDNAPDSSNSDVPSSPEASAMILEPFFESRAHDLQQLQDAVFRSEDVYPYTWGAGFNMLMPHLSKIKAFSQVVTIHSIFHTVQGNHEASFLSAKHALRLAETGESDILISRLVQFAQLQLALDAISAAQKYHAWTDEQWVEMKSILESFDLIDVMADSFRAERALGYASIEPILKQPWSRATEMWNQMGTLVDTPPGAVGLQKILDPLTTHFTQAFLAKQWRKCLEAYSFMIEDLENASRQSKNKPWQQITLSWEDHDIHRYGIFAKMLLPALDKAQSKAIQSQVRIELAIISIDLERYFLKHVTYPESLPSLVTELNSTAPVDPMTGSPLPYKRLGEAAFEIYSVGPNGRDDSGRNRTQGRRTQSDPPDDVLWLIQGERPALPRFSLN